MKRGATPAPCCGPVPGSVWPWLPTPSSIQEAPSTTHTRPRARLHETVPAGRPPCRPPADRVETTAATPVLLLSYSTRYRRWYPATAAGCRRHHRWPLAREEQRASGPTEQVVADLPQPS